MSAVREQAANGALTTATDLRATAGAVVDTREAHSRAVWAALPASSPPALVRSIQRLAPKRSSLSRAERLEYFPSTTTPGIRRVIPMLERIAVQEHDIGTLARGDSAPVGCPEELGRSERRSPKCLGGRESHLADETLEFIVGEARVDKQRP
jgi:hypothetical protein